MQMYQPLPNQMDIGVDHRIRHLCIRPPNPIENNTSGNGSARASQKEFHQLCQPLRQDFLSFRPFEQPNSWLVAKIAKIQLTWIFQGNRPPRPDPQTSQQFFHGKWFYDIIIGSCVQPADFIPKTYIFGAKAAPGYYMAKQMIRMICKLGDLINNDPAVRDKLRVVYLEEYCVSLSEHLMPAAEVSEQISLAGTEASGTGNMKFMLNGAITLGTLDGANVEIADAAGKENELIFGMLTPEVNNLKRVGYHPNAFIMGDDVANSALNFLERGWNGENFHEVTENLRSSDPYMVMADFKDYRRAQADLQKLYADRETWARMSLKNIANSGIFSADRAVLDYARDIWYASPVPMGK